MTIKHTRVVFGVVLALFNATGCGAGFFGTAALPMEGGVIVDFAPGSFDAPPEVNHESYSTIMDSDLVIPASSGVLGNDRFVKSLEAFAGATEAGGFVELDETGGFRYSPPTGFVGADHFSYHVGNANGAADSRVLIKVLSPGDVPVP